MIGQKTLLETINKMTADNFPRFIVITGQKGQGKKEIAKYIKNKLEYPMYIVDTNIDAIRGMIELAYTQNHPNICLIPDADKLSVGAKNSLLKVIEEPPNNTYFIMTLQSMENTLETIKSRCIELKMENYTKDELEQMIKLINSNITDLQKSILLRVCQNYYQIELLIKYGIEEFYQFIEKVVDNIYKVQSANSFKIEEKLDIKNDGNGYDLELFFETFKQICMLKTNGLNFADDVAHLGDSIIVTSMYQQKLNINGINKQSLVDCWIFDIRRIWRS